MSIEDKIKLYEKILAKYNEVMRNFGGLCSFFSSILREGFITKVEHDILYKDLCEYKGKRVVNGDFIWTPFMWAFRVEYLQSRITKLKAELEE